MSLAQLAAFAASNRNPAKTPLYELPILEARSKVVIKDGNRPAHEDGSQALTLSLGRFVLNLDVIAKGASRVVASKYQVKQFTGILQTAINDGDFDTEISAAQVKARPKAKVKATVEETPASEDISAEQAEPEVNNTLSLNKDEPDASANNGGIDGLDFGALEV